MSDSASSAPPRSQVRRPVAATRDARLALPTVWVWTLLVVLGLASGCGAGPPAAGPSSPPLPPHPRVLIFGDSYTEGAGANPISKGYAYQVGAQLGWDVTVDGAGGTGYDAPSPTNKGPFLKRLPTAPPGPFDLILLQGSSNDERQPLPELAPAIEATVSAFRVKYPSARIVMLGPIDLYGSAPEAKVAVNDTLRDYASSHSVTFIDAIAESWFAHGESRTMANPTNGHPSNLGHLRIRDRLCIDLSRLTAEPGPG